MTFQQWQFQCRNLETKLQTDTTQLSVFSFQRFALLSHSSQSCSRELGQFPLFLWQLCHSCHVCVCREELLGLPDLEFKSQTAPFSCHLGWLLLLWVLQVSITITLFFLEIAPLIYVLMTAYVLPFLPHDNSYRIG